MSDPHTLARLFDTYRGLVHLRPQQLTYDQRRGLLFYRAELRTSDDQSHGDVIPVSVTRWVENLTGVDGFVTAHGRGPTNNRRQTSTHSGTELRLAEWLRTQRKAHRAGRLCSYQVGRLEALSEFEWQPIEAGWDARFETYRQFVITHGRAPTERRGPSEKALANWGTKQRASFWARTLPVQRRAALESLSVWTWGRGPHRP